MAVKHGIHLDPSTLKFSIFSSSDIRKLSVTKISTSQAFDEIGNPLTGGLYDLCLGPCTSRDICKTCFKDYSTCTGHFGHIELCLPVFNPFFLKMAYNILRITCLSCFKLQLPDVNKTVTELQLQLVDAGYIIEAEELEQYKSEHVNDGEVKIKMESGVEVPKKVAEYHELLLREPYNQYGTTKSTESIRNAILNNTMAECITKKCIHCKQMMKRVKFSYKRLVFGLTKGDMKVFYENEEDGKADKIKATNRNIFADECRQFLRKLYQNEAEFLKLLFPVLKNVTNTGGCPLDALFMEILPVTPPIVRPCNKLRGEIVEHPQTTVYKEILRANNLLKSVLAVIKSNNKEEESSSLISKDTQSIYDLAKGTTSDEKLYNAWNNLQSQVDLTLDVDPRAQVSGQGLKQIIEKKEGLIRMHMMGKRVNFAARTVITPDPNIGVDEIGIPEAFALKLTYPIPVTPWNIQYLRKIVTNGPNVHPGACFIESGNGQKITISPTNETQRQKLAKTLLTPTESRQGVKIVHRHLHNGDVLLLNRQPTLHKPSIMAHKARILKGEKTFRLHYSNCKSYNADFDGDEMNAHFAQNDLARSEAYNVVNVAHQYLVPKDGTPLGGLIQDHIISGVKLMLRGKFFNRHDYQQYVFQGLSKKSGAIKLLPPTILKPIPLWSGKQIVSTIIQNLIPEDVPAINLTATAKIGAKAWQTEESRAWAAGGTPLEGNVMTEAEVIIRHGELLCGILDKNHYGATPYGLIHSMYELYGGDCSTNALSAFSKLFTYYLQREGFTLGVKDIIVLEKADKKRAKIIKKCRKSGRSAALAALELDPNTSNDTLVEKMDEAYTTNPKFRTILDRKYKQVLDSFTNDINKTCIPTGLVTKFPDNNLQLMVQSGAKGSTVNTMQISALLGQIELEGKRPPLMISRKSLPSFPSFETSPRSGGFIDGRFLSGIRPQEFFFHCMAGREGLIDTAVKTSRSGYLQRCLIKHLEGLCVHYDMTVRDSDNSVVQFMYGEDGMDICKAQFFKTKTLEFLNDNRDAIVTEELLEKLKSEEEDDEKLKKHKKKLRNWIKKNGSTLVKHRNSAFKKFSDEMVKEIDVKNPDKIREGRSKLTTSLIQSWNTTDDDTKASYLKKSQRCPDPTISKFSPDNHFASVSEYLESLIATFGKTHKDSDEQHAFTDMMSIKSITSLAAPGEPVGLLAAQSIGEPSTQMTLNTFHFAGRGEMNVTLGIPRLREILMLASKNIKTPSMDIPFLPIEDQEKVSEKLRIGLNKVTVADVLETVNVKTKFVYFPQRGREYVLRFNFLPRDGYKNDFCVKPKQIIKYMSKNFFKQMFRLIIQAAKEKNTIIDIETDGKKKGKDSEETSEIDTQGPNISVRPSRKRADDSSDDDEPMGDDVDATDERKRAKQADERDYDEPEVEEEIQDADVVEEENEEDVEEVPVDPLEHQQEMEAENAEVVRSHEFAEDYTYDKNRHLWCQIRFCLPMKYKSIDLTNLLRNLAQKSIIWEVSKINRAITYMANDRLTLKTDGINIHSMFKYDTVLDLNKLYTNDIHAVATTYGIEAAARVIVKEVQNVFKVYGITVDPRHLLLIADYMTFDGTFQPLSRKGMESSASPLQQMSFESSLVFLKSATIQGRADNLASPSSRLMVGQPCRSGTGAFTLVNDNRYILKSLAK